jgi:hypothetical protein
MFIKIPAAALAAVILLPTHHIAAQSAGGASIAPLPCRHCERPSPFEKTQGIAVTIMLRDGFAKRTVDAVIRDEPGSVSPALIAIKRTALTPALLYRAFSSLSESRVKHNGPPTKRATTVLSSGSAFEGVPTEDRAWVADLMTRLSAATPTEIAGVGKFPAVTLTMDKNALRGR